MKYLYKFLTLLCLISSTYYSQASAQTGLALKYVPDAKKGIATALCKLGSCYEYGYGVNVDLNIALEYYKEAALRMDPFAIFRIGYFYQNGLGGLLKDNQWAFKYYFRAYLLGSCDAMYRLAAFYEKGEVCSKNLEQAVMLYYLSGSSMKDAKRCESLLSKDSINEPTKYSEAYLKYSKDPYNNSKAMYLLSQVYKYGDSVFKKDENLWKLWLEKSACNEFAPAMAELGEQYMKEERYSDAVKWLNKASVNGDQKSMSNLAFIYSLKIPGISATDELIVDLYITAGEFNTIRKHYSNLSNVSDNQFKARQIEMYKLLNGLEIKQSPNTATPINTYKEPVNNNPKSSKMVNCTHCNGSGKVCEVKSVPTYGTQSKVKTRCKYCSELLDHGIVHTQKQCPYCQGKGYKVIY